MAKQTPDEGYARRPYPHALDPIELKNEWIGKFELAFYPRRAIRVLASSR